MLRFGAERAGSQGAALAYYGRHIPYAELLDEVHACAAGLLSHGVRPGDHITIYLPNIPQCVIAVYAANMIGAVCNMVHPLSTPAETGYAVDLTESRFIFTFEMNEVSCLGMDAEIIRCRTPAYFPKILKGDLMGWLYRRAIRRQIPKGNVRKVTEWDELLSDGKKLMETSGIPEVTGNPEDTAVIMYTGGTTGPSKGVMLSNAAVNSLVIQLVNDIGGGEDDIIAGDGFLAILPMFHAFGLAVAVHTPLSAGMKAVLLPKFGAKECAHTILAEKAAYIAGVPAMYERMYQEFTGKDLSFIRLIVAGGDRVGDSLINRYNQLLREGGASVRFRPGYGLTEACSVCALTPDRYHTIPSGCIGIPLQGNRVCTVIPGTDTILPDGEEGELCLFSPANMTGYYRDPSATGEVLRRHADGNLWLHTGDVVKIEPDGLICFRSRYKRLVKVNGYNVYPMLIEEIMLTHPDVAEVCAIGIPWKHDTRIKLFVTLRRKMDPVEAERKLIEYAVGRMNRWSIPASVEVLKCMPRTRMEKTDYRALEEQELLKHNPGEHA
jgi:long-chain acyl-CoA synthetase